MNIYDTVQVFCIDCAKPIGEVDFDAKISNPLCSKCATKQPDANAIASSVDKYQNVPRPILVKI